MKTSGDWKHEMLLLLLFEVDLGTFIQHSCAKTSQNFIHCPPRFSRVFTWLPTPTFCQNPRQDAECLRLLRLVGLWRVNIKKYVKQVLSLTSCILPHPYYNVIINDISSERCVCRKFSRTHQRGASQSRGKAEGPAGFSSHSIWRWRLGVGHLYCGTWVLRMAKVFNQLSPPPKKMSKGRCLVDFRDNIAGIVGGLWLI